LNLCHFKLANDEIARIHALRERESIDPPLPAPVESGQPAAAGPSGAISALGIYVSLYNLYSRLHCGKNADKPDSKQRLMEMTHGNMPDANRAVRCASLRSRGSVNDNGVSFGYSEKIGRAAAGVAGMDRHQQRHAPAGEGPSWTDKT
jgi:hypothetical protein